MPPVLAFGALGFAGYLAFKAFTKFAEDQAKQEAFRAANGWSLEEVAAEMTSGFDQDGDGRLVFDVVRGARMLGESTRTTVDRSWSEPLRLFGIPTGATAVRETRTTRSLEPTLRKADTDGDGIATRPELVNLLRTLDADGNGRLTRLERSQAHASFGAVLVSRETKTVGVLPPEPKPATKPVPTSQTGSPLAGTPTHQPGR